MATRTGYYLIDYIAKTGIYHIYEVTYINTNIYNKVESYKVNNYPICSDDKDLYLEKNNYKLCTEIEVINFIRNILDGRKNKFRLCENCMRTIIAERQDRLF
ncbi:hypothetical protein [uncultured Brachyspira sp.]|uniref:hypothetical protein n=1 Tax=uncultured Brachyspira sp. TaxID=221953 RepID=UPI0026322397|nr:hypothetical protein [uncultured Brachyspira sp.]